MPRKARMNTGPAPKGEWRKKVHPFFVQMMEQFKQIEPLSRSTSEEDRAKAQQWARDPHQDLRRQAREVGDEFRNAGVPWRDIGGKILDLDLQDPSAVKEPSDDQYMLSWLSWYKYGKTWRQLQHERSQGNWTASQYQKFSRCNRPQKWNFKLPPRVREGAYWIGISSLSLAIL